MRCSRAHERNLVSVFFKSEPQAEDYTKLRRVMEQVSRKIPRAQGVCYDAVEKGGYYVTEIACSSVKFSKKLAGALKNSGEYHDVKTNEEVVAL